MDGLRISKLSWTKKKHVERGRMAFGRRKVRCAIKAYGNHVDGHRVCSYGILLLGACSMLHPEGLAMWMGSIQLDAMEALEWRKIGSLLVHPAVAIFCIKDAALHGRLRSDTYRRLIIGNLVGTISALLATTYLASCIHPFMPLHASVLVLAWIAAFQWWTWKESEEVRTLGKVVTGLKTHALSVARDVASGILLQKAYAGLSLIEILRCVVGASLTIAKLGWTNADGLVATKNISFSIYLSWMRAVLAGLAAVNLACLEDAAGRNRLSASTFRTLNASIFVQGGLALTVALHGGAVLNNATSWAALAIALVQMITGAYGFVKYRKKAT